MKDLEDCAKSELDIFNIPPTQTSVIESSWDCIYPHPNFKTASQIRFDIAGSNSHCINLAETKLHLKIPINCISIKLIWKICFVSEKKQSRHKFLMKDGLKILPKNLIILIFQKTLI